MVKSALEKVAPELLTWAKQYEQTILYYMKKDPPIDQEGVNLRTVNLNMLHGCIVRAEGKS